MSSRIDSEFALDTSVDSKPRRSSVQLSRRTTSIMECNPEIEESEYIQYKTPARALFHQIHAMIYRRWIKTKRSIVSLLINMLVTLIVSCLTIIIQFMMDSLISDSFTNWDFNSFSHDPHHIVVVADDFNNKWWQPRYCDAIQYVYHADTGNDPTIHIFDDVNKMNEFLMSVNKREIPEIDYISIGFILPTEYSRYGGNNLTLVWNDTESISVQDMAKTSETTIDFGIALRVEMAMLTSPPNFTDSIYDQSSESEKEIFERHFSNAQFDHPSTLTFIESNIASANQNTMFAIMAPMLIAAGILSISATIIPGPIAEIRGPIRNYMVSCSLKLFPYWFITFIFDFIVYEIDVLLIWLLFIICGIDSFTENKGMTFYMLFICGPCIILFIYCMSFIFTNPDNAARNSFLLIIVFLIIPIVVMLIGVDMNNPANSMEDLKPEYWVYSFFPPMLLEGYMQAVFMEYQYNTEGVGHYFKSSSSAHPYSIFAFIDIVLYAFILFCIEKYRIHVQRLAAKTSFGNCGDFFREQKAKHPVTKEAEEMAKEVELNDDWAVKIQNVSRLFFNTEGKPIPAVNCVSLGVKKGSIFGFLGANGAGKTTLINMITSMLPMSAGKIEINGKDISTDNDSSLLSVCPQFNTHLCSDMTISEHFHLYSLLHCMSKDQEKRNTDRLVSLLDLESFKDIPIRELSEGDVRKLSIALSFLGRAKIILLDEPTATLDPVSMTQVHEMMLYYKGKKTFMLCTHLLSEAEALCDMISIMIKGHVYTCGSPQYLSSKFGTDYKIDLMIKDSSDKEAEKVDEFFKNQIPTAYLNISRPTARIYNVPANSIQLHELFRIMEDGKEGDNGYSYYTCSSSSLEKVFMEIVHMSEGDESPNL